MSVNGAEPDFLLGAAILQLFVSVCCLQLHWFKLKLHRIFYERKPKSPKSGNCPHHICLIHTALNWMISIDFFWLSCKSQRKKFPNPKKSRRIRRWGTLIQVLAAVCVETMLLSKHLTSRARNAVRSYENRVGFRTTINRRGRKFLVWKFPCNSCIDLNTESKSPSNESQVRKTSPESPAMAFGLAFAFFWKKSRPKKVWYLTMLE